MSKILIEEAIDQLYSYLYQNIESKLAALTAQYDDDIVIETITDDSWYIGDLPPDMFNLPTISIIAQAQNPEYEWANAIISKFWIQVVITVGGPGNDSTLRFRRLARYARAVYEMVKAWENEGGGYIVTFEERQQFSSVMTEDPFVQAVGIPITLVIGEDI